MSSRGKKRHSCPSEIGSQMMSQPDEEPSTKKKLKYSALSKLHTLLALLPNGTSLSMSLDGSEHTTLASFIKEMKHADRHSEKDEGSSNVRKVDWGANVFIEDTLGSPILNIENLYAVLEKGHSTVIVQDGHPQSQHFDKDLWNVTPEPEMLGRLPQGYNLETALADQVDNALQAVWDNKDCRRLVSVDIHPGKITIFDTGLGMDASQENSIAKWGTVGASTHRNVHHLGVGGKPPFLKPYLGKYGAGGVAAALHLGGKVVVSSKTKLSKKVVSLVIEKQILVERHEHNRNKEESNARIWRTAGEFRDMTDEEKQKSPHGSFTCIEITSLKRHYFFEGGQQYWRVNHLRQLLKDIYALYIQSDQMGGSTKTLMPVEFEVNGINLIEELGGEITLLNQHSCNGEPFIVNLHLKKESDGVFQLLSVDSSVEVLEEHRRTSQTTYFEEANAQITCYYYPNLKGKEELQTVLEKMDDLQRMYTFESMPRVGIRWLGRLLPETKWPSLPFMEVSTKKEKQGIRRQWAKRVRAFIDTDAGFHPTQSKTALEGDHPFTVALQHLGLSPDTLSMTSAFGVEVTTLHRNRVVSLPELIEEYFCWVKCMHDNFDEEVSFEDEPVYVINQENLEELLSVSKSVVVFHKHMKGATAGWNTDGPTPLRIRLQKGLTGTRSDLYATIEYFFYDGTEEEHGEVKMVCRPIAVLECDGSKLQQRKGCCYFELNKSKWLPVVHLNSDKCQRLTDEEWKKKVMELENKQPGYIEILNEEESKYFNVEQALPNFGAKFQAGYFLPKSFLVAVRPRQGFGPTHKQGMIVAESLEMKFLLSFSLLPIGTKRSKEATVSRLSSDPGDIDEEVLAEHIVQGSFSRNGVKGIYLFNTKDLKLPEQLTSRGFYVFRFSLIGENYKNVRGACCSVQIIPSETTSRWSICSHLGNCDSLHPKEVLRPVFRLKGQLEEPLYLSKYDEFNNQQTFEGPLELKVALLTVMEKSLHIEAVFQRESICLTDDKLHAKLKNIALGKGKLHSISESYNAILRFYLPNDKTVDLNVKVLPGKLYEVLVKESYPRVSGSPLFYDESLRPGDIIEKLVLQGYDEFGNVVDDGQILKLKLEGLELLDKTFARQVDNLGCVHLEGILKVTSHFNTEGYVVILSEDGSELLQISFRVVTRILQFVNKVPKRFYVGRHLEGLEIEIVDQNGVVDTSVEGPMNTLALSWTNSITCPLRSGRCSLPTIELPKVPGLWKGEVSHSFNPGLKLEFQVEVELAVAMKLAALSESEREQKVWEAHCGEPFKLPFIALDDLDQLAIIPKGIVKQLSLRVERQEVECEFGDVHLEQSKAQRGADGMFYEVQLTMSGQEGLYKILAECPNPFAESKPGLGPISWMVNLYPGFVVKLAPVISKGEWLPHELKEATGDPISSILVPRCSMFPVLDVYLLDSSQNICSYYEGSQLALEILNCVQWVPKFTNVSNGHGTFGAFQLDLAIGSYELKVTIHILNGSEPPLCHEAQINLQVTHGNYPSALKLLTDETIVFNLEGNSRQFLPVMELLVESADGLPLKKDFRPILRFMDNAEYYGDLVEFSSLDTPGDGKCNKICCAEPFQEMIGQHSCVRKGSVFSFSHVHAPSRSGTYSMVFSLSDPEISSVSLTLTVKHGPPAKVDFFEEQHGHEIHMLKVKVVDAHGNQCIEVNGAKLRAELIPTNGFMVEQQDIGSCVLLSTTAATVENGEACFGDVHLGEGMEGIYCLRVFEEDNLLNLTAGSAQLIVIRGKTMLEPINRIKDRSEKLVQLIEIINKVRKEIQSEQEKKASLESSVTALQEELRKKVKKHDEVEKDQKAFLDDEILDRERHQENRSEEDVIADFRRLASGGNGVSLAFWEARLSRNFLSPSTGKPEADDIIGQVVMLARVEGDPLNRILSEYIGLSTLLLIVCKSQQGIQALEAYDSNGDVDETKGLYGFAHSRGYKISGRYQAICLSDIKPYRHPDGQDPVDLQHCQNLLRIPPPVTSSGRHLTGFLGYAVNLLHLKEEHLSISIKGRCVGLRETLFFSLFSTLQVYDSRKNMYLAKDSCKRFHGGAVSLDGGIIRSNLRQELGKHRNHVPVRFPLVPFEERIKLSLLSPTCHAFQRSKLKRELTGNVDTLHTQISCELADIEKINSNIADLSNNVQILEVQIQNIQNKVGELKAEVLNYKKAHDSVFLDKHDDDDRLRVLMM